MARNWRNSTDMAELIAEVDRTERGMGDVDDSDDDDSDALLDLLGEDHGDEEDEDMETAMTHTCAGCGEENEVLVPKGYTLLKKPATLAESDPRRIDREWEPALSFREAYERRLREPRTAPMW